MGHYKSNLRDLEFNLFEVFGADKALGQARSHHRGPRLIPQATVRHQRGHDDQAKAGGE